VNHRRSVENCDRYQNQGLDIALGQVRQQPERGPDGIRHNRGGVTVIQAQVRNRGTCHVDAKGAIQSATLRGSEYQCDVQGRSHVKWTPPSRQKVFDSLCQLYTVDNNLSKI